MPQKPDDLDEFDPKKEEKYILNGLFGSEDFSSIVRVVLHTKPKSPSVTLCDRIMAWRTSKPAPQVFKEPKTLAELTQDFLSKSKQIVRSLLFHGVIIIKE
jgi:hypothetical protein